MFLGCVSSHFSHHLIPTLDEQLLGFGGGGGGGGGGRVCNVGLWVCINICVLGSMCMHVCVWSGICSVRW